MNTSNVEIFKEIPNYEGFYQVSNIGNVKNRHGKILSKHLINSGYYVVDLHNGHGKETRKKYPVHILMAMAFYGHVPNRFTMVCDHINEVKTDNRIENIRIVTSRFNTARCMKNNTSGIIGVHKRGEKYYGSITANSKYIHLGVFDTKEEAEMAYLNAIDSFNRGEEIKKVRKLRKHESQNVYYNKKYNNWKCSLTRNGKQNWIGTFKTEEEAYKARNEYLKTLPSPL